VVVTAASTQDRDGAKTLLAALANRMRRLRLIWADGGYAGALVGWVASLRKWGKVRLELGARRQSACCGVAVGCCYSTAYSQKTHAAFR
jgi:hypothetical protein